MSASPVAYHQVREGDEPPPQELTWDSTIKELIQTSYHLSDELDDPAHLPRFIRMFADRWSVRWDESGISVPEDQSCIDIFLNVRPSGKATIALET